MSERYTSHHFDSLNLAYSKDGNMDSDDFTKKRVMHGALDSCCGMWAPAIFRVCGGIKDDIPVSFASAVPDGLAGSAPASDLSTQVVMKKV